jgi:hypothetical protein
MIDRRKFFLGPAAVAGALVARRSGHRKPSPRDTGLKILFVHTGERFNNLHFADGAYILAAVKGFLWTCRDFRANEWKWIHP